jgi:selenium-binding protein 1
MSHASRWTGVATLLAASLTAAPAIPETCLSPYITGLRQPEKVMYVWTLPALAPGEGADFLSIIDVDLASPTYGTILRRVEVGSVGNEAHHMGFTDDRTKIWAAALNTSRFFIFDVGTDPRNPPLGPAYALRDPRPNADQHGVGT